MTASTHPDGDGLRSLESLLAKNEEVLAAVRESQRRADAIRDEIALLLEKSQALQRQIAELKKRPSDR